MRIACVGDVGVDHYLDADLRRPGGCSLNLAVNLARLAPPDTRVEVVSVVGDDEGGRAAAAVLRAEGIASHVAVARGATPVQRIRLLEGGERRFAGYLPGVLDDFSWTAEQCAAVARADVVVAVVYSQFERLFRQALACVQAGQRLVVDFMDLEDYGGSLAPLAAWLPRVSIGFFGLTPGHAVLDKLREASLAQEVTYVVTLGAMGAVCFDRGLRYERPALAVATVVDTTGAGDAYAAAFLRRRLAGAAIEEAMEFAARHAAQVVQRLGAF